MKKRTKKCPAPSAIVMAGVIPRYQEDDVAFVMQELPKYEPCSIGGFTEAIGANVRWTCPSGTMPSKEYNRMYAAFLDAQRRGLIIKPAGRSSWRVLGGSRGEGTRWAPTAPTEWAPKS
jgi:hypothetical protein